MGTSHSYLQPQVWHHSRQNQTFGNKLISKVRQYELAALEHVYSRLTSAHLANEVYLDRPSFTHLLPFGGIVNGRLCAAFDYDDNDLVNWRDCLGGLALYVDGDTSDVIHFIFAMHNLLGGFLVKEELHSHLTSVLYAAQRIHSLDQDSRKGTDNIILNVEILVENVINKLFNGGKVAGLNVAEFQLWAEDNTDLIQAALLHQGKECERLMEQPKVKDDPALIEAQQSQDAASKHYTYTWKPLLSDAKAVVPMTRNKHASCLYNGHVYIYGGKDGNIPLRDLWSYDLVENKWNKLSCTGEKPPYLEEHTMVAYKGQIYMFGGEFGYGCNDDVPLWILDIDTKTWQKYKVESEVMTPGSRRGHSAVIFNNGMHIYGGYVDLKGSSSEFWTYDFESGTWHLTYSSIMTEDGPGARHCHTAVVHDNAMWMFGGMTDLHSNNDLWKWSFSLRKWTRLKMRQAPTELYGHTSCKLPDSMLVFGGESCGFLRGEMWRFHFGSVSWQKVQCQAEIPSARTRHTMLIVPSLLLHPKSGHTDRANSVPHLRGSMADVMHNIDVRPFSSPPFIAPGDQLQRPHVFKNRISPSPEQEKVDFKNLKPDQTIHPVNVIEVKYSTRLPREPFSTPNFQSCSDKQPLLGGGMRRSLTEGDGLSVASEDGLENPVFANDLVQVLQVEKIDGSVWRAKSLESIIDEEEPLRRNLIPGLVRTGSLESIVKPANLNYTDLDHDLEMPPDLMTFDPDVHSPVQDDLVLEDLEYDADPFADQSDQSLHKDVLSEHWDARYCFDPLAPRKTAHSEQDIQHYEKVREKWDSHTSRDTSCDMSCDTSCDQARSSGVCCDDGLSYKVSNQSSIAHRQSDINVKTNTHSSQAEITRTESNTRQQQFTDSLSKIRTSSGYSIPKIIVPTSEPRKHPHGIGPGNLTPRPSNQTIKAPATTTTSLRTKDMLQLPLRGPQLPSFSLFMFGGREAEAQNLSIKPISAWRCDIVPGKPLPQQVTRIMKETSVQRYS